MFSDLCDLHIWDGLWRWEDFREWARPVGWVARNQEESEKLEELWRWSAPITGPTVWRRDSDWSMSFPLHLKDSDKFNREYTLTGHIIRYTCSTAH